MNTIYWTHSKYVSGDNQYWNPLELVSTINKSESYENLSLEDKVNRLEKKMKDFQSLSDYINFSKNVYISRINNLILNTKVNNLRELYEESPNYYTDNITIMFNNLIWLSYSDDEKKVYLNQELEEYFN